MGFLIGVKVLDLATVGPAARATRWLADYGASVIKVGPVPTSDRHPVTPPYFAYGAGRGIDHVSIDLKAPPGVDLFLDLAARSDIIIESFRPGVVDRLGIGPAQVHARNPRLIYCSTTGYGRTGPYAQRVGHDLNYLAMGGYLATSGHHGDDGPGLPGATIADAAAGGMQAVIAILAALFDRTRTGQGAVLDVSVTNGVLALMALQLDQYLATGDEPAPGRDLLTGGFACYGLYRTLDDRWLAVAAIEPKFWGNLCEILGRPHWIPGHTDPARQAELRAELAAVFATHDQAHWTALLADRDTCVTPVLSIPEVVGDPQYAHRHAFTDIRHDEHGEFRQLGPVLAGCQPPADVPRAGPGEVSQAVLAHAGIDPRRLATLLKAGVIS